MAKPRPSARIQTVRSVPRLPRRPRDGHKGDFGRVLVIGGSVGMSGAPALTGLAALRSGAGLVTLAVPRSIQPIVATLCPCATSIPLPETASGRMDPAAATQELRSRGLAGVGARAAPDALVIGMGIGREDGSDAHALWALIDDFRIEASVPVVIDADALNLAVLGAAERGADQKPEDSPEIWNRRPHPRTIITPHPGELARMWNVSTGEIQIARQRVAISTAATLGAGLPDELRPVVVLKGAGTIVTDARRLFVNRTGNPGMATGGSGDVLGGIIGALVGQRLSLFDAAVLGAHVHGLAGDLAARDRGEVSLIAADLIEYLSRAFSRAAARSRSRRTS